LGEETDVRNRDAFREYMTGSLWVLPGISAVLALVAGFILSRVPLNPESPFAFRGTEDDARTLLSNVTSTVVTVIALVLGLTARGRQSRGDRALSCDDTRSEMEVRAQLTW